MKRLTKLFTPTTKLCKMLEQIRRMINCKYCPYYEECWRKLVEKKET